MRKLSPKAILFDLDGTLLDTVADIAAGVNGMLAELGRPQRTEQEIRDFVGQGFLRLVERCLTEGHPDYALDGATLDRAADLFRKHYALHNGERTQPYPRVVPVIEQLAAHGKLLAVVTNKFAAFTTPLLEKMDIVQHFSAVVSGDSCATRKPDPEMVRLACEKLRVQPEEALMVGDSANDALAARAAGVPVLLVRWGYSEGRPVDSIECDGILSSADEIFDWLA